MAGITQDLSLSRLSAWLAISGPIFPVWEAFLFLDLKLDPRRLSIANNPSSWKHFFEVQVCVPDCWEMEYCAKEGSFPSSVLCVCLGEQVVERSASSQTLFWAARKRKGQVLHLCLFIGEHTPSMLQLSVLD